MSLIFCDRCGYSVRPDERGDCPTCRTHLIDPGEYQKLLEQRRRETEVETWGYALEASGVNPWLAIWTRPRDAIREVLVNGSTWPVFVLAAVGGVCGILSRAHYDDLGNTMSLGEILVLTCVVGPLSGLATLYVFGACLFLAGRVFGGKASSPDVRLALSWPNAIALPLLLVWGIALVVVGRELFTTATPQMDASAPLRIAFLAAVFVELALSGWFVIVLLICVGEVQRFGIWKTLASSVLAVVVFFGLLVLVIFLFQLLWRTLWSF